MSACGTLSQAICPCGLATHPALITNAPGLATISYRPGDYSSFRHALLLPCPGETQLTQTDGTQVTQIWRPGAQGDLAVQMIEWWAYLCDILTFYNERIANQDYLGTADLPESVNRLVDLLGYRPRPGIGATGLLAALTTGADPVTLPAGFQVQSKPGPGPAAAGLRAEPGRNHQRHPSARRAPGAIQGHAPRHFHPLHRKSPASTAPSGDERSCSQGTTSGQAPATEC